MVKGDKMSENVRFRRKIGKTGDSLMVTIPSELVEFVDVENGQEVTITGETGKKGKFLAIFKE